MSYKSENWKEKLEEVRKYGTFTERKEGSVEKSADDIINEQIEEELRQLLDEEPASPDELEMAHTQLEFVEFATNEVKEYLKSGVDFPEWLQNKLTKAHEVMKDIHAQMEGDKAKRDENEEQKEEVEVEETPVKESVEKSIQKLTEKNMLGRLAKQLKLNEQGKKQMFAYFEKGELQQ